MVTAVMVSHGHFDAEDHRQALLTGQPNEICVGPVSDRTAASIETLVEEGDSEGQPVLTDGPVGQIVLHYSDGSGIGVWGEGGMDRTGRLRVLAYPRAVQMDGLMRRALIEARCTGVEPLERWYEEHPAIRLP